MTCLMCYIPNNQGLLTTGCSKDIDLRKMNEHTIYYPGNLQEHFVVNVAREYLVLILLGHFYFKDA